MSSLSQFEGRRSIKGVGLLAYLKDTSKTYLEQVNSGNPHGAQEMIEGTNLPVLYEFFRKPAGMWGQWVVFRYNGEEHVPDLSIPITLEKLPQGAQRVPDQAAIRYWLDDGTRTKPAYDFGYEREDRRLVIGLSMPTIGETGLPVLYEYPLEGVRDWLQQAQDEHGINTFFTLPSGAKRIPDQAALRCWFEALELEKGEETDGRLVE